MKYKNKFYLLVMLISIFFISGCTKESNDIIKLKSDYESYNNKKMEDGNDYIEVEISEYANVKFITLEESKNIINKNKGILLYCSSDNQDCRNIISILLQVEENTDIDTIYYINIKNIEKLEKNLEDYNIENINIPLVLFVNDGNIIASYNNVLDTHIDINTTLTDEEIEKVYNMYINSTHDILNDVCEERC